MMHFLKYFFQFLSQFLQLQRRSNVLGHLTRYTLNCLPSHLVPKQSCILCNPLHFTSIVSRVEGRAIWEGYSKHLNYYKSGYYAIFAYLICQSQKEGFYNCPKDFFVLHCTQYTNKFTTDIFFTELNSLRIILNTGPLWDARKLKVQMNSPSVTAHISLAMALLWTYTTFT